VDSGKTDAATDAPKTDAVADGTPGDVAMEGAAGAPPAAATPLAAEEGGCGCRVPSGSGSTGAGLLALLGAALASLRRRRRG
jgi:MYXO-CTERM domain-containing protein